jgi:hypothetical protein
VRGAQNLHDAGRCDNFGVPILAEELERFQRAKNWGQMETNTAKVFDWV